MKFDIIENNVFHLKKSRWYRDICLLLQTKIISTCPDSLTDTTPKLLPNLTLLLVHHCVGHNCVPSCMPFFVRSLYSNPSTNRRFRLVARVGAQLDDGADHRLAGAERTAAAVRGAVPEAQGLRRNVAQVSLSTPPTPHRTAHRAPRVMVYIVRPGNLGTNANVGLVVTDRCAPAIRLAVEQ